MMGEYRTSLKLLVSALAGCGVGIPCNEAELPIWLVMVLGIGAFAVCWFLVTLLFDRVFEREDE
jgi:hypothetical protein